MLADLMMAGLVLGDPVLAYPVLADLVTVTGDGQPVAVHR